MKIVFYLCHPEPARAGFAGERAERDPEDASCDNAASRHSLVNVFAGRHEIGVPLF
jgi:hypothetical protein